MKNQPRIEWCGVCWIESKRSLSERRIRKLPLCMACLDQFLGNDEAIDKVFAVWDAMPDFDSRPEAFAIFNQFLGKACSIANPRVQPRVKPEPTEEEKAIWQAKRTLNEIRKLLKHRSQQPVVA